MSALEVPVSVNSDQKTIQHFAHPRRLDKTWCGADREPRPYQWVHGEPTCLVCIDLLDTFGGYGWRAGWA